VSLRYQEKLNTSLKEMYKVELKGLVKEVLHETLTIAENCDAIITAADRADWVLQVFNQVQVQQGGRTVETVLALLERDFRGCTTTYNCAAQIGVALSDPPPAGDVLAWLMYEAKRIEERVSAQSDGDNRAQHMAYATRLRGYQACLACLGVELTDLLFRLRDADLKNRG